MSTSGPFVTQIDLSLAEELRQGLIERGFSIATVAHTLFQAKKEGISCTLYSSGKLVVQGKQKDEFIEYYLEPEILKQFTYRYKEEKSYTAHMGSDESGKGDYFGPLCVATVYATEATIKKLIEIGVKDSKKLRDPVILELAKKIRSLCSYHQLKIGPTKYNELIQKFGNLNHLLAWAHATAIEALYKKSGAMQVIVDRFAYESLLLKALKQKKELPEQFEVIQKVRAEEDPVVAAASILARASFVEELAALSALAEIPLPKGGGSETIKVGKVLLKKRGQGFLSQIAKLHFKNTEEILRDF